MIASSVNGGWITQTGGSLTVQDGGLLKLDGGGYRDLVVDTNTSGAVELYDGTSNSIEFFINSGTYALEHQGSGTITQFEDVTMQGGFSNAGTYIVDTNTAQTTLTFSAAGSIAGTGVIELRDNDSLDALHPRINTMFSTITQESPHTIHGSGDILPSSGGSFINQGIIRADDTSSPLVIHLSVTNSFTNGATGLVDVISGAELQVIASSASGGWITQTGGSLTVQNGGLVKMFGGVYDDLVVNTNTSGAVELYDGTIGNLIEFRVLGATYALEHQGSGTITQFEDVTMQGGFSNAGTYIVNEVSGPTDTTLTFSSAASIDGTGEIELRDNTSADAFYPRIDTPGSAITQQSGHTIRGSGKMLPSGGGLFINQGTIRADDVANPLTIHLSGAGSFTNGGTGLVEVLSGVQLEINGISPSDQWVNQAGAILDNSGAVSTTIGNFDNGGTVNNNNGATFLVDTGFTFENNDEFYTDAALTITGTYNNNADGVVYEGCSSVITGTITDNGGTIIDACNPNPADKISWWRAENNANDSVGGNDGTEINGATYASGKVNQAFSLDSAFNQYVRVPGSPSLEPQQLTLEAWIFPTGGSNILIASKDENTQAPGSGNFPDVSYALLGPSDSGKIQAIIDGTNGIREEVISSSTFGLNQFYHVAMTWDGTTLRLYVNGQPEGTSSNGVVTIAYDGTDLGIGAHPIFLSRYFDGLIDEVSLFSRALSQQEIQSIFLAGANGKLLTCGISVLTPNITLGTGPVTPGTPAVGTFDYQNTGTGTIIVSADAGNDVTGGLGNAGGTHIIPSKITLDAGEGVFAMLDTGVDTFFDNLLPGSPTTVTVTVDTDPAAMINQPVAGPQTGVLTFTGGSCS